MSLLNYLEFQKIEAEDTPANHRMNADDINLGEELDGDELSQRWSAVIDEIHNDPNWFSE